MKDALHQLDERLPGSVLRLQARDVFSPLSEERFEAVPLDLAMLDKAPRRANERPALDQVLMLRGESGRLAVNRVLVAKRPARRARKKQVA